MRNRLTVAERTSERVLNGSNFINSGLAATTAGTRSKQNINWL